VVGLYMLLQQFMNNAKCRNRDNCSLVKRDLAECCMAKLCDEL